VNGEKIVNALHQLHEEGYWRSLEEAVAAAEDEEEEINQTRTTATSSPKKAAHFKLFRRRLSIPCRT
jgi:hypothetical protein